MRRASLLVALLLAAAAPAPAAASDDPEQLAAAVERDIVHVDPGALARVSEAEAGRLRLRIVRRNNGRIKILVATPSAAQSNGGVAGLANAVAREIEVRGAL